MKKIIILVLSLIFVVSAFAQKEKKFDNEFYFRFGYSCPSWKQFGLTKEKWGDDFKRRGFTGEIGTIFMLNGIRMPEGMALGIDVDYLGFYWHRFSNSYLGINADIGTLRFDSKIGPSFTYSPAKRLAFDVFIKADFNWVSATAFVINDNKDDAETYTNIFAVGISTGFNIRYSVLMLGFEYNTVSPKLENTDIDGEYIGNAEDIDSDKSPLGSINFTIGLSF
jgi:hypothetical protein